MAYAGLAEVNPLGKPSGALFTVGPTGHQVLCTSLQDKSSASSAFINYVVNGDITNALSFEASQYWPEIQSHTAIYDNSFLQLIDQFGDVAGEYVSSADVAVLASGFSNEARSMLTGLGYSSVLVDPTGFDPNSLLQQSKILVMPSGSAAGLSNSSNFITNLKYYVQNGGILIVFDQQNGSDFSVLPGNPTGIGWAESSSWSNGSAIFSAGAVKGTGFADLVQTGPLSIPTDGSITSWPTGAKVLSLNASDSSATSVLYPYGKGYVLVTTAYPDWQAANGGLSSDEQAFVQDMINSALENFNNVNMATPTSSGFNVPLSFTVANSSGRDAANIELVFVDPEGSQPPSPFPSILPVNESVPAGSERSISANISLPAQSQWPTNFSPRGLWRVDALLVDSNGKTIQWIPEVEYFEFPSASTSTSQQITTPAVSVSVSANSDLTLRHTWDMSSLQAQAPILLRLMRIHHIHY